MANSKWYLSGDFYGSCSCAHLRCPCPGSNYTELPTRGWCKIVIGFHVERGQFEDVNLDGRDVVMVADVPGVMADGNWSVGLIFDDRSTPEQQQALATILSGQAGGPMEVAVPWVSKFLGAETRPIEFKKEGLNRSLSVPGMVDVAAEGLPGANPDEPVYWDNLIHPANTRVAIGKGVRINIHAFGIDFNGGDGSTFTANTTFNWQVD